METCVPADTSGMQNPHFVTIRKLEVAEMARVIRISNRGVTIRRAVTRDG
jgi:hypothetical protein